MTGSSGFIGGRVSTYLGAHNVLGVDIVPSDERLGEEVVADISSESFAEGFRPKGKVEAIVHAAAIISPTQCALEPLRAYRVNLFGTLNMLELARRLDVERFVYISSGGIYGSTPPDAVVDEGFEPCPRGVYATTKLASELAVKQYCEDYSISGVALRITAPYGPKMNGAKYPFKIPDSLSRHTLIFAIKCVYSQDIVMPAGGDHTVNYTYVDDIAEAVRLALTAHIKGFEAFNIAGGRNYTIRELGGAVASLCPAIRVSIGPGDLTSGYDEWDPMLSKLSIKQGLFDVSKANRMLGYSPRYDIVRGMGRLIEYVRSQAR